MAPGCWVEAGAGQPSGIDSFQLTVFSFQLLLTALKRSQVQGNAMKN
jgi:hypothetical protein